MKKCPYCSEKIQETAKKCKYCGEFLSQISQETKKSNSNKLLLVFIIVFVVIGGIYGYQKSVGKWQNQERALNQQSRDNLIKIQQAVQSNNF